MKNISVNLKKNNKQLKLCWHKNLTILEGGQKRHSKKKFAIFSPVELIDLLQYLSHKTCLILHLGFPVIKVFLLLDFFFSRSA